MGRVVVTIEWAVMYAVGLLMFAGLCYSATPRQPGRVNWVDFVVLLAVPVGLGLIIWQGAAGHLPGTAGSGRSVLPFLARLLAWAGGLSIGCGLVGALVGFVAMNSPGSSHSTGEGIIVVIPATMGVLLGGVAGLVVAIVKTIRS